MRSLYCLPFNFVCAHMEHKARFTFSPIGHSGQLDRRRPCSHIDAPPQSLHWDRRRPCSQICGPPHCLHAIRWRPCSHMDAPPQSLHRDLWRLCSHIDTPPQSLQLDRWRLCSHIDAPTFTPSFRPTRLQYSELHSFVCLSCVHLYPNLLLPSYIL